MLFVFAVRHINEQRCIIIEQLRVKCLFNQTQAQPDFELFDFHFIDLYDVLMVETRQQSTSVPCTFECNRTSNCVREHWIFYCASQLLHIVMRVVSCDKERTLYQLRILMNFHDKSQIVHIVRSFDDGKLLHFSFMSFLSSLSKSF